ncbi:hypothetical protein [Streptomyces sp. NPDC056165]|uniref:hypothetical protein n=1 Tax=Streptomyces sp. NPDC056165 TaxID=3345733 RepID=UPI0035D9588D
MTTHVDQVSGRFGGLTYVLRHLGPAVREARGDRHDRDHASGTAHRARPLPRPPPQDPRNPQALDLLATISARVQALPPDAAIADITGAELYFERGPQGLAPLIRLRTLAWTGVHTTIGAGSSLMLAAVTEPGSVT